MSLTFGRICVCKSIFKNLLIPQCESRGRGAREHKCLVVQKSDEPIPVLLIRFLFIYTKMLSQKDFSDKSPSLQDIQTHPQLYREFVSHPEKATEHSGTLQGLPPQTPVNPEECSKHVDLHPSEWRHQVDEQTKSFMEAKKLAASHMTAGTMRDVDLYPEAWKEYVDDHLANMPEEKRAQILKEEAVLHAKALKDAVTKDLHPSEWRDQQQ